MNKYNNILCGLFLTRIFRVLEVLNYVLKAM